MKNYISPSGYITPSAAFYLVSAPPPSLNISLVAACASVILTNKLLILAAIMDKTTTTPQTPTERLVALRAHARDRQHAFFTANSARAQRLSVLISDAEQHNDKIDVLGARQKGFWDTPLYLRMVAVVLNSQREVQTYHDESMRLEEDYHRVVEEMKQQERVLMMREGQAERRRELEEGKEGEQGGEEKEEEEL